MYLGIDVGGTKTLIASFSKKGIIKKKIKIPTPKDYLDFLSSIKLCFRDDFNNQDFKYSAIAIPATVFDKQKGVGVSFGNLPWKNVPIHNDIELIVNCPTLVSNDAKLGGLSEALLLYKLDNKYSKVLYITVSTGIGYSLIVNGIIDENTGDGGGKTILLEHHGSLVSWESFASGQAIVRRYGKKAMNIHDKHTWQQIAQDLSIGMIELIAIFEPDIIIIGGSVGSYFDRFGDFLKDYVNRFQVPLLPIPIIQGAKRAEEAVIYGCYDLIKQHL